MNNSIQLALNFFTEVFTATEQVLDEWKETSNLQFPVLMNMVAVKMNLDESNIKDIDPFIRYYIRKHPDWCSTRGAHGGCCRRSEKQKKEANKNAKDSIKNKMKQEIESKLAEAKSKLEIQE
jgi:hypothetical protein